MGGHKLRFLARRESSESYWEYDRGTETNPVNEERLV